MFVEESGEWDERVQSEDRVGRSWKEESIGWEEMLLLEGMRFAQY